MQKRDFNNPYDEEFDFDNDGQIDMLEQYAEIEFLSGSHLEEGTEIAYDYFMHSKDPDFGFPISLVEEEDDLNDDE